MPCTLEPVPRTGTDTSAGFFVDDDIEAAAALKGVIAVIGLAGEMSVILRSARMQSHSAYRAAPLLPSVMSQAF